MKIGIEWGPMPSGEGGDINSLVRGLLTTLFEDCPEQEFVLFLTSANRAFLPALPSQVESVVFAEQQFFQQLDDELKARALPVLFRTFPRTISLSMPLSRQVVLIPDVRHEFFWELFPHEEFARRQLACCGAMRGAGAIVVFTEQGRQVIQTLSKLHCPNVIVMSPNVNVEELPPSVVDLTEEERESLPQATYFLYPADLLPHKNHRRLFKAFERFLAQSTERIELVLTGDPAGWEELAAAFPRLPVRHLGNVRKKFLQVLIVRARALVYFSLYEGFAPPLLEAFRAGTPIVCSNTSCLPEIVGDAALTCDPENVEAIYQTLQQISHDEELRKRLIARGPERLAQYISHDGSRNFVAACSRIAETADAVKKRRPILARLRSLVGRCARRAIRVPRRAASWFRSRFERWLRPQLGVHRQYPPRRMAIPSRYGRASPPDPAPVISVVTPSYNQAAFLERTLLSVLGQNYPRLEYIVQDGGSSDDSAALLEQYGDRLTHWESARDRGQAHAINLGFRHAGGEIMAYLNSDDLLLPGSLAYVARYFVEHPDVDVVYGHRIVVDPDDREIGRCVLPPHDDEFIAWDDFIPQETMFWRRRIWERVGLRIDENFHFALDWDLILRFRDAGARFARLPRFLGAFRHQPEQKSLTLLDVYYPEVRRLRQRCHGHPVSIQEIGQARRGPYLRRQVWYQVLYAFGLLRH